ncbi:MAG: TIGR04211 family SH3 domain-containing protein [Desulfobacterales bacterium]
MKMMCAIFSGICAALLFSSAYASTMYVTDKIEIMMRRGASTEYKIIKKLQSGDAAEVLETQGSWTRIRIPDGMEGWVNTQFLTQQRPKEVELKYLQDERENLSAEVSRLSEENKKLQADKEELSIQCGESQQKREAAVQAYEQLRTESKDFLEVKEERDKAVSELETLRRKAQDLEAELKAWKGHLILTGVGVALFLFGFLLGVMNARSSGRIRGSYLR